MPDQHYPYPLHLLLVEDDTTDAALTLRTLERAGFALTVDQATQRQEAKGLLTAAADARPYDVIVADFRLPTWRGLDVLDVLDELNLSIPLVLLTGYLGREAASSAVQRGAAAVVLKDELHSLPRTIFETVAWKGDDTAAAAPAQDSQPASAERNLLDHAPVGLCQITSDGKCVAANSTMANLLGYGSAGDLLAIPFASMVGGRPDALQSLATPPGNDNEQRMMVWKRRDGHPIRVGIYVRRLHDSEGHLVALALAVVGV